MNTVIQKKKEKERITKYFMAKQNTLLSTLFIQCSAVFLSRI